MGERSRFEELVELAGYAASKDLILTSTHYQAPDGKLVELQIAGRLDADPAKAPVRRSITFSPDRDAASFREERPKSGGGRTAVSHDVSYDFSVSYRIADVWKGRNFGDDRTWEELDDGKDLIDFLAARFAE